MPISVLDLKPGDKVITIDGNVAEIVSPTDDGEWILVRYVESSESPELVGAEDLCNQDELEKKLSR